MTTQLLDHRDYPRTVRACRKLLAYLLRGTFRRVDVDRIGRHRADNLSGELKDALVPLLVAHKGPLPFYRALCERWDIDPTPSGSERGYAAEAWLPEGRMPWAQALAAMDPAHVRVVVHEGAPLLAQFATTRPRDDAEAELEAAMFDQLGDGPSGASYRAVLPSSAMVAPRTWRTVWTLASPMAHGADEKHGNVNLFRRRKTVDPLTGETHYVQYVAGNAVRGMLRDLVMDRWLGLLGLRVGDLGQRSYLGITAPKLHALFSGGTLEQGADTAGVRPEARRRARGACPAWDLFAGTVDNQLMAGRLRVLDAVLVCRENAWLVADTLGRDARELARELPEASECSDVRLLTRHAHREWEGADGMQMMANTELLAPGSQMVHGFQLFGLDGVPEVTAACFADLLREWSAWGFVGAGNARGYGSITFDAYRTAEGDEAALPDPRIYTEYVTAHADEARAWLREEAGAAKEKPAKGAKKAAPPPPAEGEPGLF